MAEFLLLPVVILLSIVTLSHTLIAYDCGGPSLNTTVVSLRTVKACQKEDLEFYEEKARVQIIQRDEVKWHPVQTCLVELTRVIFHCGMHSHSSIVNNGISTYITALGGEECRNVHRYKSLTLFGHHNIGNIIINGTTSASFVLYGALSIDGTCRGASYSENGYHWHDVTVSASVKITTKEYYATLKLDSDEISLSGGIICPFLKSYCIDSTFGETVWDLEYQREQKNDITILYEGIAQQVINRRTKQKYIIVEEENKIFALSLVKVIHLWQREIWQTEHPRLVMVELKKEAPLTSKTNSHPANTNLLTYVNSKFLYIEQSYKRELNELYVDALYRRCELKREILKNRLMIAQISPLNIGWMLKNELGYIGRVLGEVIYLLQCLPRPVTVRRAEKCFNELPILVGDKPKFMSPMTHIIQEHAEEVDCNSITPPMFYVNNEWLGLNPNPLTHRIPDELKPENEEKLEFKPIRPLGQGGIYTQEEVERSQKNLVFGLERKAVENILVRRIAGMPTDAQGYDTLKLFNPVELKTLAKNSLQYLWGWFTEFGMFMSGIFGIYIALRTIKYILGVGLNGWQIYRTLGCGFAILASLWNGLTSCILHRYHIQNSTAMKKDEEPAEVVVQTIEPKLQELSPQHWTNDQQLR